jgi:flagellar biosynthesis anti-sigma factor FlgM
MKIENNGISPLSTKRSETTTRIEKKDDLKEVQTVRGGQDKAEMSENARLLAKARAALGNADDVNSERLAILKQQIESGDYTVKVGELARKLAAKFYPK